MRQIREFELRAELGRGPHTTTYEAVSVHSGKSAVLKEFHGTLPASAQRRRRVEAVTGRLQLTTHNSVIPYLRLFWRDDRAYLVRVASDGPRLEQRAPGARMMPADVVRLLAPLLEALEPFYAVRLVHGNLSPSNVLVADDGRLALMDLACVLLYRELERGQESPPPSPFVAPEMWSEGEVEQTADVYSLARLISVLLAGNAGRSGADASLPSEVAATRFSFLEVAQQQSHTTLMDLPADLPPALASLLRQSVMAEARRRPTTLVEFWGELLMALGRRRFDNNTPVNTVKPSRSVVHCRQCGRAVIAVAIVCPGCGSPARAFLPRIKPPFYAPVKNSAKTYFHDYGDWLMEHGRIGDASRIYARATQNENTATLLRSLGLAHMSLHNYPAAQGPLACALQMDHRDEQARLAMAQALIGRGNYSGGMRHYQHLQESRDPDVALAARMGVATCLAMQRRLNEALPMLDNFVFQFPDHANARFALGEVLWQLNERQRAEREWTLVLALAPGHLGATQGLRRVQRGVQPNPSLELADLLFYL